MKRQCRSVNRNEARNLDSGEPYQLPVTKFDKTLKMSVEPAHLRSNPPASAGPARPLTLARPPSPPGLPLTSLAGPRSILIAALITISAMRAHPISQSYFIVPRRSLKMLRGRLAPSGYRPRTTSLSRSPMTFAAPRFTSETPTSARRSSTQIACFPSTTAVFAQKPWWILLTLWSPVDRVAYLVISR
jgi:hypothetical protein